MRLKNRSIKTAKKSSAWIKYMSWTCVLLGVLSFSGNGYAGSFPYARTVTDRDDIVEKYQTYLQFVVEVGKHVDPQNTKRLVHSYSLLKKRSLDGTARFLKGLRFEMNQKSELMGASGDSLSSNHPEIRRWVAKFMKEWAREADEHLFRTYSQLARK